MNENNVHELLSNCTMITEWLSKHILLYFVHWMQLLYHRAHDVITAFYFSTSSFSMTVVTIVKEDNSMKNKIEK